MDFKEGTKDDKKDCVGMKENVCIAIQCDGSCAAQEVRHQKRMLFSDEHFEVAWKEKSPVSSQQPNQPF